MYSIKNMYCFQLNYINLQILSNNNVDLQSRRTIYYKICCIKDNIKLCEILVNYVKYLFNLIYVLSLSAS